MCHGTSTNAESSRLRSTETTSSDISAIWPGALLVVYLAVTGLAFLQGYGRVSPASVALHFAMLAAIAAATWLPMVPSWLRAWAPLLALPFLYSEMPVLIAAVGHVNVFDSTVIGWERALFGSQPAVAWAARWPSRIGSEILHLAYLSYYGIIFSVPVGLHRKRHRAFSEAVFALMLTFIACFLCYLVFPVAGPRYFWTSPAGAVQGPVRSATLWLLETGSSRGTAFPSSHVAVAVAQSILAARYFGRRGLWIAALTVGLALGAVYGGFHYAVDVIAGALFGASMATVGLGLVRRSHPGHANATAPT
jgi:membrane-associated phospholipid phosphatase